MKIIIADDSRGNNAHYYMRLGLAKAFASLGHECILWDIFEIPAITLFDKIKPDLFFGQTYNIDRGLTIALKENPQCKVIMKGGDWSDFSETIDLQKYPVVVADMKERKKVIKLIKEAKKPDLIEIHYHKNSLDQTHKKWTTELGIPVISNMPAADIYDYTGGIYKECFSSDIFFVGGIWGYKSQIINKWFTPLCSHNLNLNIKVFGNRPWGIPQYCGFLPTELFKDFAASSIVCPNLSEPHAHDFGYELNERVFKLLSNKCGVVSDYTESLAKNLFPNGEILFAKTPEEFKQIILALINGDLKIEKAPGYNEVIKNHTYHSRIVEIFENLGLQDEKQNAILGYENIKQTLVL